MNSPDLLTLEDWRRAESALAGRIGLEICPACGATLSLLEKQVGQSDFSVDQILSAFNTEKDLLLEFGYRYYRDCCTRDYGEEWDPAEGNQQQKGGKRGTVGIGEGFLVNYTMYYLYASRRPDLLVDFVKRRRIPHATKVAKDIKRVFASLSSEAPISSGLKPDAREDAPKDILGPFRSAFPHIH